MDKTGVDRFLRRVRRVHRIWLLLQLLSLGAAAWIAARASGAISEKYLHSYGLATGIALGAALLVLLVQTLVRFTQRTERRIAHELDQRFALKERLTTYLQIRSGNHPFFRALTTDTEKQIQDISPWKAVRSYKDFFANSAALILMLLGLFLIPYLPVPQTITATKEEHKQMQEQAKRLEQVVQQLQKKEELSPEMKKFLSEALKETRELQKPEMQKAEALKKLNALQDKLNRLQAKDHTKNQKLLAEKLNQLQNQNKNQENRNKNGVPAEDFEKLTKEIQEALGDQAKDLDASRETYGDKTPSRSLTQQDYDKMKKALEDYKKEAADTQRRMAEMQHALENAQKGIGRGNHRVTADSRIKERDIEKGRGGVEDGAGTTNVDTGPQHFSTKKQGAGEYVEDKTKAEYEQIYKGERTDAVNDPLFLGSHWNDKSELRTQYIRTFGVNSDSTMAGGGGQVAPQNQEESEIRKEKVPATYQKMVKDYFESIQGNEND